ncbi:MAG: hypothetical protein IPG53_07165 [Ignavibacteriales bacterium]|nr:hypothetical protein [Ignavibacteriales bacterium]
MEKVKLKINLLLRRLTVMNKLSLIGLVLGVPLTILLVISLNNLMEGVDFAEKEQSGIKYIRPLSVLKVQILKHKSFTLPPVLQKLISRKV